jgi:hypothetical protein
MLLTKLVENRDGAGGSEIFWSNGRRQSKG